MNKHDMLKNSLMHDLPNAGADPPKAWDLKNFTRTPEVASKSHSSATSVKRRPTALARGLKPNYDLSSDQPKKIHASHPLR